MVIRHMHGRARLSSNSSATSYSFSILPSHDDPISYTILAICTVKSFGFLVLLLSSDPTLYLTNSY